MSIFFFFFWGGGGGAGAQKNEYLFGYENFVNILWGFTKLDFLGDHFYAFYGLFLGQGTD